MFDDLDQIFGELEDADERDLQHIEDVAETDDEAVDALSQLDEAELENPDIQAQFFGETPFSMQLADPPENKRLAAQFFGETPLNYGTPSPIEEDAKQVQETVSGDAAVDALTDLEEAEEQDPGLAAQFFGDTPFNYGTPSPTEEDARQETSEQVEGDVSDDWGEILREAQEHTVGEVAAVSPAFRDYVTERVARSAAAVEWQKRAKAQWRDWEIDFGPAWAPAGETLRLFQTPQVPFRGEKVMATDTGTPAGQGTLITSIIVGQRLQRPALTYSLTAFFSQQALGNGITFDTARHATRITIGISFVQSCTFFMALFGKALIAQE